MRTIFFVAALVASLASALNISSADTFDDFMLAEIPAPHTCMSASQRVKNTDLPNFDQVSKGNKMWTDTDFLHDDTSLFWTDMGESNGSMARAKNQLAKRRRPLTWTRASEAFPDARLFATN